jgi:signal transduction histidine kinase
LDNATVTLRRALALSTAGLVIAFTVLGATLNSRMQLGRREPAEVIFGLTVVVVLVAVALVILLRSSAAAVGWLLMVAGASTSHMFLGSQVPIFFVLEEGNRGFWPLLAAALPSWISFYGSLAALALVFPDGRLPSRRWRPVLAVSIAAYAAAFVGITLSNYPFVDRIEKLRGPFAGVFPDWVSSSLFWLGGPLMLAALAAGVAAIITRYRRSAGIERLQIKWLAYSMAIVPATLATCAVLGLLTHAFESGGFAKVLFYALLGGCALGPSAAITVAVTRHGLYEIDRLINRTLVYGALTVLLGAAWAALALLLGVVLGQGSAWATAGATLAVALAFRPLRARVQSAVDWRFDRARYEGLRRVREFEDSVREGRSQPEEIATLLAQALRDREAQLLFRLPPAGYVASDGRPATGRPPRDRTSSPVERNGQEVALLLHDPRLLERPDLFRSLLRAAGLTIEIARLRLQVRLQLAEVEASRARILEAGYEERRRLERDLHDGAQQRLVSLGIALRRMQRALPPDARLLAPALDQAVQEVGRAISDLRAIAAGLRPAGLDEGLAAALADLARQAPVPIELNVTEDRLPASIETTAYFVACEAVTNAVKHALPSHVRVSATRQDGELRLVVVDDGVGGARPGVGSGLVGLADRVEAHGGHIRIESRDGAGTRVEVELPCGS